PLPPFYRPPPPAPLPISGRAQPRRDFLCPLRQTQMPLPRDRHQEGCEDDRLRARGPLHGIIERARITLLVEPDEIDTRAIDLPEDRKSTRLNSSHVKISY